MSELTTRGWAKTATRSHVIEFEAAGLTVVVTVETDGSQYRWVAPAVETIGPTFATHAEADEAGMAWAMRVIRAVASGATPPAPPMMLS